MWLCVFCFFKQKTAYEMRISDWSSDVCSSDLPRRIGAAIDEVAQEHRIGSPAIARGIVGIDPRDQIVEQVETAVDIADRIDAAPGGNGTGCRGLGGRALAEQAEHRKGRNAIHTKWPIRAASWPGPVRVYTTGPDHPCVSPGLARGIVGSDPRDQIVEQVETAVDIADRIDAAPGGNGAGWRGLGGGALSEQAEHRKGRNALHANWLERAAHGTAPRRVQLASRTS